eukprot:6080334-Alexandrium_andersonii.AAC.1
MALITFGLVGRAVLGSKTLVLSSATYGRLFFWAAALLTLFVRGSSLNACPCLVDTPALLAQ